MPRYSDERGGLCVCVDEIIIIIITECPVRCAARRALVDHSTLFCYSLSYGLIRASRAPNHITYIKSTKRESRLVTDYGPLISGSSPFENIRAKHFPHPIYASSSVVVVVIIIIVVVLWGLWECFDPRIERARRCEEREISVVVLKVSKDDDASSSSSSSCSCRSHLCVPSTNHFWVRERRWQRQADERRGR